MRAGSVKAATRKRTQRQHETRRSADELHPVDEGAVHDHLRARLVPRRRVPPHDDEVRDLPTVIARQEESVARRRVVEHVTGHRPVPDQGLRSRIRRQPLRARSPGDRAAASLRRRLALSPRRFHDRSRFAKPESMVKFSAGHRVVPRSPTLGLPQLRGAAARRERSARKKSAPHRFHLDASFLTFGDDWMKVSLRRFAHFTL